MGASTSLLLLLAFTDPAWFADSAPASASSSSPSPRSSVRLSPAHSSPPRTGATSLRSASAGEWRWLGRCCSSLRAAFRFGGRARRSSRHPTPLDSLLYSRSYLLLSHFTCIIALALYPVCIPRCQSPLGDETTSPPATSPSFPLSHTLWLLPLQRRNRTLLDSLLDLSQPLKQRASPPTSSSGLTSVDLLLDRWRLKAFIPTVLRTTASYYIWGRASIRSRTTSSMLKPPFVVRTAPQESWPISIALFTALARYQAASSAAERRLNHDPSKPLDPARVMQASRKRLERWMGGGGQPKGGAAWEMDVQVKKRELKGALEEADSRETGERSFKVRRAFLSCDEVRELTHLRTQAEWVAHRSLLTGERQPEQKVILYAHGGAYTLLSPKTHRALLCQISKETGARALCM